MSKGRTVLLVVLLVAHAPAHAVVFHDGVSNAQRMVEFLWQQAQEIRNYTQWVTQAQQMVEQVKGTYQMITYAAENLAHMPDAGNIFAYLTQLEAQTTAVLGQVNTIGFRLDQTTRQFAQLYGNVSMLTTPAGRAQRLEQMRAARLEMTGVAMQTQSIKQTFSDIYARLGLLLGLSSSVSGQTALQQLQMQQAALAQKQSESGLTMQATAARLVAMEHAENILRQQMADDSAREMAAQWYATHERVLPQGWNGFRIPQNGSR